MNGRTLARAILIVITGLVVFLYYPPLGHYNFAGRWGDGTYGIAFPTGGGTTVTGVVRGSPADRAGIHPGDHVPESAYSAEQEQLAWPRAGEHAVTDVIRPDGSHFTASMTAVPVANFTWWDRASGMLAIIPATVFLIVAFMLVYLRPDVMTWAFFVYAISFFETGPLFEYYATRMPHWAYFATTFTVGTLFGGFSPMPLLPFVLRFPNDTLDGWRRKVRPYMWAFIALAYVAYVVEWLHVARFGTRPWYESILENTLPLAVFAIATAIVIASYKTSSQEARERFRFLFVGLIVSFIAYAAYFWPGMPFALGQIIGYATVLMPISIGYAVLRRRVLDINFVLNRAIAYAMLSVVVIAFVSLLDWTASRLISEEHWATAVELAVTIGIGFLLDRINRTIGGFVEAVLFRKRRSAERYLRRAAAALPYATGEDAIADGLVHEPVLALELAAGALYRSSDGGHRFQRIAIAGTRTAPDGFDRDDNLVRFLKAEEEIVWLDELRDHLDEAQARPYVLAVPVLVRHQLEAFTLYGAHRNATQIDPDEVALLKDLAVEAARAYDHVDAVRTRELLQRVTSARPETA